MKALLLAAGEGTRLRPLTYDIPKALVQVGGKSLLEHNMDRLLPYVDGFIVIVKYKQEKIQEQIGGWYNGIPVRYHIQNDQKGTGAAIQGISVSGEIVIVYADAIISQSDVDTLMSQPGYAVFGKEVQNPEKYGIFILQDGDIKHIVEKPQSFVGNLANFGFFKVNHTLLEMVNDVQISPRGEIEITDAINLFLQKYPMKCVLLQNEIIDVTSLDDLEAAHKKLSFI